MARDCYLPCRTGPRRYCSMSWSPWKATCLRAPGGGGIAMSWQPQWSVRAHPIYLHSHFARLGRDTQCHGHRAMSARQCLLLGSGCQSNTGISRLLTYCVGTRGHRDMDLHQTPLALCAKWLASFCYSKRLHISNMLTRAFRQGSP